MINFNSLHHGHYRFNVRAELPGGPGSQQSYEFEMLPQFWETAWFRALCVAALLAAAWAIYQLRLRQIRSRFGAGAGRARPPGARNPRHAGAGLRRHLLAIGRGGHVHAGGCHARALLPGHGAAHGAPQPDRGAAQRDGPARVGAGRARIWRRRSNPARGCGRPDRASKSPWRSPGTGSKLPEEMEQHLLRIAQEAVTNALKHAGAQPHRRAICTWRRTTSTCGSGMTAAASISRTCFPRAPGISD